VASATSDAGTMTRRRVALRRTPIAAALLLALAADARPGAAADLVRWRTPDGREGLADDASRVPPGAEIVSVRPSGDRRPPREPAAAATRARPPGAPAAATPGAPPGEAAAGERLAADAGTEEDALRAGRCAAAGLARDCSAEQLDEVAGWRGRARSAREERARAEERAAAERERWERCRDALTLVACRDGALEAAEADLARATAAEERVTDACRREGCRPEWLREEPFPVPEAAGAANEAGPDYAD